MGHFTTAQIIQDEALATLSRASWAPDNGLIYELLGVAEDGHNCGVSGCGTWILVGFDQIKDAKKRMSRKKNLETDMREFIEKCYKYLSHDEDNQILVHFN